jgi:myo-inositol-1(or 4)-monophosphatase
MDFRSLAEEVSTAVAPLLGTHEGEKIIGRGASGQYTRRIDKVAEDIAIRFLEEEEVSMVILSEEAGKVKLGEDPEYICLIDPIDGSFNAIHGIPICAFSLALAPYHKGASLKDIEYGIVRNIATGDVFEAKKGKGAKFNGKNIKTAKEENLEESTICLYIDHGIGRLEKLVAKPKRIRTLGCVALELCYLARGDYHAFVDLRRALRVTDIAAGKLIVEEAGGIIGTETGSPLMADISELGRISIIAGGNYKIYEQVMNEIRE